MFLFSSLLHNGDNLLDDALPPSHSQPYDPSTASLHCQQVLVLIKFPIAFGCCAHLNVIINESVSMGSCKMQPATTSCTLTCMSSVGCWNTNNIAAGSEKGAEGEDINMFILGGICLNMVQLWIGHCHWLAQPSLHSSSHHFSPGIIAVNNSLHSHRMHLWYCPFISKNTQFITMGLNNQWLVA